MIGVAFTKMKSNRASKTKRRKQNTPHRSKIRLFLWFTLKMSTVSSRLLILRLKVCLLSVFSPKNFQVCSLVYLAMFHCSFAVSSWSDGPMFRSNDGKAMTMSIQSRERQQSPRLLYTNCLFIKCKRSVCLFSSIQLVIGNCFTHSRRSN
jgi:hypothetical protein